MSCRKKGRGYIYIWMLFAVMLAGIMLAAAGIVWRTEMKREKESELLFAGDQFRRAIESYYNDSGTEGGGVSRYPTSLEQLLKDERSPAVKRHLRRIYFDPMTNSRDWGLIRQQDGGITGVYSLSSDTPARRANFPTDYAAFEKAENYQGWKFIHAANTAGGQGVQPPPGGGEGLSGSGMVQGLPGAGFNPLQQSQPASGVNTSPAVPAGQPPSDNGAF